MPRSHKIEPYEDLPQRVLSWAREHGYEQILVAKPLVIGVSGGADSLALLHVLVKLRAGGDQMIGLHVAHLD
ncbi:MAG: hypothetical protein M3014_13050, partial [Chloroflexota bacterium]|nr:hypothetical protein [Chloroflexota bacterium]